MLPIGDLFLTEGIWDFVKKSFAGILRGRKSIDVKNPEYGSEQKIMRSEAIHRRLTPRGTTTEKKLGFRAK